MDNVKVICFDVGGTLIYGIPSHLDVTRLRAHLFGTPIWKDSELLRPEGLSVLLH